VIFETEHQMLALRSSTNSGAAGLRSGTVVNSTGVPGTRCQRLGSCSRNPDRPVPSRVRDTLWPIPPHTSAKLDILKYYLDAWFPIMATWNNELVYLDGFAGPGVYSGGEDGSPVVALKAGLFRASPVKTRLKYIFIEQRQDRAIHLHEVVDKLHVPAPADVEIRLGSFNELALPEVARVAQSGARIAPLFAFVDPFSWDASYRVVAQLLAYPFAEILVNFMVNPVQRFLSSARQAENWDALFGTSDWRIIRDDPQPENRTQRIVQLYRQQLFAAGARYVLPFSMRDARGRTSYSLFFATKDEKGLEKMKEAMWRVDGTGRYFFRDPLNPNQPQLLDIRAEPDYSLLRTRLSARFGGLTVSIQDVERFVLEDTPFLKTHLRRQVLAPMEADSPPSLRIVDAPSSRRRGTYPTGTQLYFRVG
jgi:three-Cys-motif partner protein